VRLALGDLGHHQRPQPGGLGVVGPAEDLLGRDGGRVAVAEQRLDTSTGAQDGQWRRCDYTGIAIAPRAVLGSNEVELYTFELKAEGSGNVVAVHEAEAQTRGSHYGYLVWHIPDRSRTAPRLDAIERECQRTGVGLILFSDPQDLDSFDHRMAAARRPTEAKAIDCFLATRLDGREMETIKARLAR
jgi:hypothetical protein